MPETNEPREGFQVLADLTNRYLREMEMHAGAAVQVGPFASVPAVALPQAQHNMQRAISEAFHAGAAFQASIAPTTWAFAIDPAQLSDDTIVATLQPARLPVWDITQLPDPRIDLAAVAEKLPRREPNPYVQTFLEDGLQLFCPTCHHHVPVPRHSVHTGPCTPQCRPHECLGAAPAVTS